MQLRFEINHAEAMRRGINIHGPTVSIEVDPEDISSAERTMLADRMKGTNICMRGSGRRIRAYDATYEALMEAVKEDNERWRCSQP